MKHELSEFYPADDEFADRFPVYEHRGGLTKRAKYILTQIEYFSTNDTGEYTLNSGTAVHLEHIIPQKISTKKSKRTFGDWENYLGEKAAVKHKRYVHRIGNMTLLAGDLNIAAYNNPFTKKKKSYRQSNITITNSLAKKSNFKFSHVDDRGEKFAKQAVKIWKIDGIEVDTI